MTAPAYLLTDPLVARLIAAGQDEDAAASIAERAAVLEFDAGMPRERAESRAVVEERKRRVEGVL